MRDWRNVIRVVWVTLVNTAFSSLMAVLISLNFTLPLKIADFLQLLLAAIVIVTCLFGIVLQLRKRPVAFIVNMLVPTMLLIYVILNAYLTHVPAKLAHAKIYVFFGECVMLTSVALVTVAVYVLTAERPSINT